MRILNVLTGTFCLGIFVIFILWQKNKPSKIHKGIIQVPEKLALARALPAPQLPEKPADHAQEKQVLKQNGDPHSKQFHFNLKQQHLKMASKLTIETDIFTALNLIHFKEFLEGYEQQIEKLREVALLRTKGTWNAVYHKTTIDAAKMQNFFNLLDKYSYVKTVQLKVDASLLQKVLPVGAFYESGSTKFGCEKMDDPKWVISFTKHTYGITCFANLNETLKAKPIDSESISVGLPYYQEINTKERKNSSNSKIILTFVNIIENAIIGSGGELFAGDICVMTDRCSAGNPQIPKNQHNLPLYDEILSITEQTRIFFYHLTLEDLPRVVPYLSFLHKHQNIKVHISYADFHVQMLEMLGISEDRLVWGDVRARVVYLPAGTECGRPSVFTTSLLSLVMNHYTASKTGPVPQDTIVLMKRSDPSRQYRNHDAILEALEQVSRDYNLTVKVFDDDPLPPLQKSMEIFYSAKAIIAPHGSGVSNLLFARPGTLLIEGLCFMEPHKFNLVFRSVASSMGKRYYGIVRKDGCLYTTTDDIIKPLQFYLDNL